MERETHRLDREALLADRRAVAERVSRSVDEAVAAAVEKRRAFLEQFVDDLRLKAAAQRERDRVRAGLEEPGADTAEPGAPPAGRV